MMESGSLCDDDSLMKTVLNKCGHAEKSISEESMEHDHRVEQHVIAPLQSVLDTEIPNIIKLKRNVTKVCLDMDSAKTRYTYNTLTWVIELTFCFIPLLPLFKIF